MIALNENVRVYRTAADREQARAQLLSRGYDYFCDFPALGTSGHPFGLNFCKTSARLELERSLGVHDETSFVE